LEFVLLYYNCFLFKKTIGQFFSPRCIIIIIKPTKEHILYYLNEFKHELHRDGIVQLGLFGSYACGENTLYSDIDIAIKKEENYLQHRNANTYFEEVAKIKRPSLVITKALSELPVEVSVEMELDGYFKRIPMMSSFIPSVK